MIGWCVSYIIWLETLKDYTLVHQESSIQSTQTLVLSAMCDSYSKAIKGILIFSIIISCFLLGLY